ncbi:DUF4166 domain-containing protein [Lysobacter enzymogenes]|uniref:DUF4166 domain-containing protein n=2 Tax=Lysobacter enzymogenes TaxID=69 RepID=A0A3N2RB67_LYSEN|nr:DUF4166 domain-containing protein [Lysobacter enzymogenes]
MSRQQESPTRMPGEPHNAAIEWFGPAFDRLHPLLQALHRDGGALAGEIELRTGRGLAGVLGRRLARRLGIPLDRPRRGFRVDIVHEPARMLWLRRFDDGSELRSVFEPVGRWPDGHWLETTGPVRMRLGVDIDDGGWRWRLLGLSARGLPLPRSLFPRTDASKRIERIDGEERYRFAVAFSWFPFGELLRYQGALHAVPAVTASSAAPAGAANVAAHCSAQRVTS